MVAGHARRTRDMRTAAKYAACRICSQANDTSALPSFTLSLDDLAWWRPHYCHRACISSLLSLSPAWLGCFDLLGLAVSRLAYFSSFPFSPSFASPTSSLLTIRIPTRLFVPISSLTQILSYHARTIPRSALIIAITHYQPSRAFSSSSPLSHTSLRPRCCLRHLLLYLSRPNLSARTKSTELHCFVFIHDTADTSLLSTLHNGGWDQATIGRC